MGYAGEVKSKESTLEPADLNKKNWSLSHVFKIEVKVLYINEHCDKTEWKHYPPTPQKKRLTCLQIQLRGKGEHYTTLLISPIYE